VFPAYKRKVWKTEMPVEFSDFSQSQKTKNKEHLEQTSDTQLKAFQYRMIPAINTSVVIH
jgi:hypothetical protein